MDILRICRGEKITHVKCRHCRNMFEIKTEGQQVCSTLCAIYVAKRTKSKRAIELDEKKRPDHLMQKKHWIKRCETAFNAMIRRRDFGKPCIACNKPIIGTAHASHYRTDGAPMRLRFDERNAHASCIRCNIFLHGNLGKYRKNMVKRIGLDAVEEIEQDNECVNISIEELQALARRFWSMCH